MKDIKDYLWTEAEKKIVYGENGTPRDRWESGRMMLCNPSVCDENGRFLPGALESIISRAERKGWKLNSRELYYRVQVAYHYKTEGQFCGLLAKFSTWHDICHSDLPIIPRAPDEPDYNPFLFRNKKRKIRPSPGMNLLFADYQKDLFPESQFNDESKLEELEAYTVDMEGVTARFHQRDLDRRAYLERLLEVVDGNKEATWGEAKSKYEASVDTDNTFVDLEPSIGPRFCEYCGNIKHTPNSTCFAGADEI